MTAGHTDAATINQRRPLTANMISTLRAIKLHGCLKAAALDQAERNAARALLDRGMVGWSDLMCYFITEAGRVALAEIN